MKATKELLINQIESAPDYFERVTACSSFNKDQKTKIIKDFTDLTKNRAKELQGLLNQDCNFYETYGGFAFKMGNKTTYYKSAYKGS